MFPKGERKCTEEAQDLLQLIDNYIGAKEQFHTSALAGIHISRMSCDNAHIHAKHKIYNSLGIKLFLPPSLLFAKKSCSVKTIIKRRRHLHAIHFSWI